VKFELLKAGLFVKFELQDAELPVKGPHMVEVSPINIVGPKPCLRASDS
jgi:hypothetical protein